jgi:SET domain-containing protein 6
VTLTYFCNSFFILEAGGEIPEELIGCAKILMMPLDEFKTTVIEGKKLPSTKLTIEVQKVLRELLEAKLAEYPSSAKVKHQLTFYSNPFLSLSLSLAR